MSPPFTPGGAKGEEGKAAPGGEKRASSDTDGSNEKPPKKVSSPAHCHNAPEWAPTARPLLALEAFDPFCFQAVRRPKPRPPLQPISDYEAQRQLNIAKNDAMLASLNLSPLVKKKEPTLAPQGRMRLALEKKLVKEAQLDDAKDLAKSIIKGTVHVPVRCCSPSQLCCCGSSPVLPCYAQASEFPNAHYPEVPPPHPPPTCPRRRQLRSSRQTRSPWPTLVALRSFLSACA